jgi:xanthine dehydrogenase large subunit
MMVTGKRHCFAYDYEIGYDDDGRILAAKIDMISRAGFSADLSGPVATRGLPFRQCLLSFGRGNPRHVRQDQHAVQHRLPWLRRTAGRAGHRIHPRRHRPQSGRDPLEIRRNNFYGPSDAEGPEARNVTHYGQKVEDNVIHGLVDQLNAAAATRSAAVRWPNSMRAARC